jgi:hypothetical protein
MTAVKIKLRNVTNQFHTSESFFEKLKVAQLVKKSPFAEPTGSLPCLQQPNT